ncbi:MAG: ABC transporter ATP-binding protein [Myxococcales bacterium]|nr:ABC transporter ATP-binding protein [Myxococcales bacterium]
MKTTHPKRAPISLADGVPLLQLEDVRVHYGGVKAIKGVSMTVAAGEIVALIGANGAGKTTTLKSIVRLLPLAGGAIRFAGRDLAAVATEDTVELGVSLVPEGRAIFPNLTVKENLELGAYLHKDKVAMAESMADIAELFPRIKERLTQEAGTLSGGEQQMLAIGRALMARPTLLLLDEPSLGIAPKLAGQIFDAIRAIAAAGVTVLLVEQNTRMALAVSQRAYVLRTGEVAMSGASADLAKNAEIQAAYLGG